MPAQKRKGTRASVSREPAMETEESRRSGDVTTDTQPTLPTVEEDAPMSEHVSET